MTFKFRCLVSLLGILLIYPMGLFVYRTFAWLRQTILPDVDTSDLPNGTIIAAIVITLLTGVVGAMFVWGDWDENKHGW